MNAALGTNNVYWATRSDEVAMAAADTQYSWTIPTGTKSFLLKLQDTTVAWRFSSVAGEVAAVGGGTPLAAGEAIEFNEGPFIGNVIYFAHSAAGAQDMRIEYVLNAWP